MKVLFWVYVCASFLINVHLASFITPCHSSDSTCLISSAQNALPIVAVGVPEFHTKSLDPLNIREVKANQDGLKLLFKDTTIKGLRNCLVLNVQYHEEDGVEIDLQCSVVMDGQYKMNGKLLLFRIEGQGKYEIDIRDIVVKVFLNLGKRSAGGKKYWQVKSWTHTAEVRTGVTYHFENLFHGDPKLTQTVTEFANSNWRDIFTELAPPFVKTIVGRIVTETAKLFHHIPIDELTL